jgi:hypothetical protein
MDGDLNVIAEIARPLLRTKYSHRLFVGSPFFSLSRARRFIIAHRMDVSLAMGENTLYTWECCLGRIFSLDPILCVMFTMTLGLPSRILPSTLLHRDGIL